MGCGCEDEQENEEEEEDDSLQIDHKWEVYMKGELQKETNSRMRSRNVLHSPTVQTVLLS